MSQMLIQNYLAELDRLRRFSGANSEQIIREAFKDLLKGYARAQHLIFVPELEYETGMKRKVYPDGSILHELRVAHGFWEAKDTGDDLDTEIARKFRNGYPQSNIIFENSETAVLIQDRQEVMRCAMRDVDALATLLERFFAWERPEIAEFRAAVAQFKRDLPAVLDALREKINAAYAANAPFATAAAAFLQQARETINPSVSEADIKEMLIQHILTEEIFGHVFNEGDFHRENNIAKALYDLEGKFFTGAVKRDTLRALEPYYAAIRANAAQITGHHEKQSFLKAIYENFYKVYNPKAADRLGVVYTPNEIVRFMIEGADWLCREHFGRALIDEGVEILDPATGTGTFICEMLEHFRGQPEKLIRKYKQELHANEVAILPYYVANLNIEATCYGITGQWAEFPNLCFVDTLDNTAALTARKGQQHDLFGGMSQENVARIKRQNERKISVVIGNPPYNAWQESFNLRNPNRPYRIIDESLRETYVRRGSAQNKNALYDMYVRFYRWASDRLAEDGIVAFVTNRNFIAKAAFDGFRKSVAEEFAEIYVVDLGGDVRENPKLSGTKHNVFGIQTGVAIAFLVKHPRRQQCRVHYAARPEYDTAEDKLAWLQETRAHAVNYRRIEPDERGNWLNQTNNDWDALLPLCSKEGKAAKAGREETLFHLFSRGLGTYRDEWVYDFSRETLKEKVRYLIDTYEATRKDPDFPQRNTIKWDAELDRYRQNNIPKKFSPEAIRYASYRPFIRLNLYFDSHFNGRTYQFPSIFPPQASNTLIAFSDTGFRSDYCVLASDATVDLHFGAAVDAYQAVPRYRYTHDGTRIDNITDWGLAQFIAHYGKKPGGRELSKDAIFAYVYGVLHDPVYRATYAQNLKRDFPRIPFQKDFWLWADWGRRLLDLHIGYAEQDPWLVKRSDVPDERARAAGVAPKPILKAEPEDGVIRIDTETTLSDIPREAFDYKLGNRSGLAWILDQYKEKTPRDPTIREKFNTYRFADYKEHVIDLITRVTRVSVETVAITRAMEAASSVKREG
ncbi:type ISP restriction/modification enzyme [Saliniramus fredricksonii]|uniref:site-specific DNA-methyltransferase (adenine-specific) n=2 Tax=Saliniramus fredricksonii TaxID=1653334 RepID=A0ABY0K749_9HYPH|nr:type ISP restriction/modification enzyme [Saliniramus fredricksonii]SCC79885.1 Methyltransferase domain-containing protein [Saliniramus fredricksonii]